MPGAGTGKKVGTQLLSMCACRCRKEGKCKAWKDASDYHLQKHFSGSLQRIEFVRFPILSSVWNRGWELSSPGTSSIYSADNFHLEAANGQLTPQAACPSEVKGLLQRHINWQVFSLPKSRFPDVC